MPLPSQRYLSDVVVPEIHSKIKHRITELLQSAKYISLTTDIWTSTNCHHSFLTLHCLCQHGEKGCDADFMAV